MAGVVERVDALQRRRSVAGFPLAVVYKFFDDQGNYLAVVVTYQAFIAIFPLLLIASSVLGFVLQGNADLQRQILSSALSQFPIVGSQLGEPGGLRGSSTAVVVGAVTSLYGAIGLGQAAQNAVNVIWAVPRNSRLNPILARLTSVLVLALAGIAVLAVTMLTSLASHLDIFGEDLGKGLTWLARLSSLALNAALLAFMMRLVTTHRQSFRASLPGAFAVAVAWQLLQGLGGVYVRHVISRVSQMGGVFAIVLGLVALIYIASVVAIFGLEINVVLARRLYPRALLTPFTDEVDLTDADRRAYASYAQAQRHKGFEKVQVVFDKEDQEDQEDQEDREDRDDGRVRGVRDAEAAEADDAADDPGEV